MTSPGSSDHSPPDPATTPGPLAGFRVLDMTAFVAGPYGGQLLGDLGADVIKIERPVGDRTRHMGSSPTGAMGPIFMNLNRNKRSVVLDLKSGEGRAQMLELVATADVFLHNVRVPAVDRLGLGYDDLVAVRPDLVYCRIVGYGSDGPNAGLPAFDDVIQGACGFAEAQGRLSGAPMYTPFPMMDNVAGMFAAQSIIAALLHRERTGEGQLVEVPMLEVGTAFTMVHNLWDRTFSDDGDLGYPRNITPHRRPFPTADGHFCIVMATNEQFSRFLTAAGRPELIDDPRFSTPQNRAIGAEALNEALGEIFATKTTAEWVEIMAEADLPGAPVASMDEVMRNPHLEAVGLFEQLDHPTEGRITSIRPPVRFSRTPSAVRRSVPKLGEHNAELLGEG